MHVQLKDAIAKTARSSIRASDWAYCIYHGWSALFPIIISSLIAHFILNSVNRFLRKSLTCECYFAMCSSEKLYIRWCMYTYQAFYSWLIIFQLTDITTSRPANIRGPEVCNQMHFSFNFCDNKVLSPSRFETCNHLFSLLLVSCIGPNHFESFAHESRITSPQHRNKVPSLKSDDMVKR